MLNQIAQEIRTVLANYTAQDHLIFNNQVLEINSNHFKQIAPSSNKSIAFIDGGQAEIISAGNFCLSFIRVLGLVFLNNQKIETVKKEFYLFTFAKWRNQDLIYESRIFGDRLIAEADLLFSSTDATLRTGIERAPISKIANVARRFAELSLARQIQADYSVLDGTLDPTYRQEEKYLSLLPAHTAALAKTSNLFTTSGNSPVILLNTLGQIGTWSYFIDGKSYFVKLNGKAKHVFRFEGPAEILPYLIPNCADALFLGYPYGLIMADKLARVSNQEQQALAANFLLRKENAVIRDYLSAVNAHEILDRLG